MSEAISKPTAEGKLTFATPETCPETCACPKLATKVEEHVKTLTVTEQALAWLELKEGQDHLKLCHQRCPYKLFLAKLEAGTNGEDVKKAWIGTEEGQNPLKHCVETCEYRKTGEDVLGGKASETAPSQSVTHISAEEADDSGR